MTPALHRPECTVFNGDALDVLRTLPDYSIQCCVTSPPYWGLRDYSACECSHRPRHEHSGLASVPRGGHAAHQVEKRPERQGQIFREVHRVLRDDGTLWLNLGDAYASTGGKGFQGKHGDRYQRTHTQRNLLGNTTGSTGLKNKDLIGIPWRVAFALQADGWYLRSDIIAICAR